MKYSSLTEFQNKARLLKGPYAIVLLEDAVEVASTITHCRKLGFREVLVFGALELLPEEDDLHCVVHDMHAPQAMTQAVNGVIKAFPDVWMHYCYNAEYLFFPFCETRNVRELIAFTTEERRDSVLTFVIDLYSNDLGRDPNAVSIEAAHLDATGYYALAREAERQMDFFGGLRWRFEQHIPWDRRKIDRVSLFKSQKGLTLRPDHTFNIDEYNTYQCQWHNNVTTAVCSFRTAKALVSNPGSKFEIPHFWWKGSAPFSWGSAQLTELGLIEPGQWF